MDPFLLKLALSFVIGGGWIALTTIAAERLGTRLGGLIGGLPSTIVVSMLFIGWTQGNEQLYHATTAVPLAMGLNAVYLITYVGLLHRGVTVAIGGALTAWAVLQGLLIASGIDDLDLALAAWAAILLGSYLILRRVADTTSSRKVVLRYAPRQVIWRGTLGGSVIALAVLLAKLGGPIYGSVFSCFPAVFTSTLVIAARSAGAAFTRSLVIPLMVSAEVNVVVYAVALRLVVSQAGLVGGSALAYGVSMVSALLTHFFLKSQLD
jgi:uncharacterized membrane protein (GlpM family)